jgi:hypothetical protein
VNQRRLAREITMRRHPSAIPSLATTVAAAAALLAAAALWAGPSVAQSQQPRQQQVPPPGGQAQPLQRGPQPVPPAAQQRPQQQPQPPQQPQQAQQPPQPPPGPYQPVMISAPQPVSDPSFEPFRNQITEIARRKDRAALARLIVAQGFFWLGEQGDKADRRRPGIDNLSRALNLAAKDGVGWEALAGYASDPTAMPFPEKKDTLCAPADPVFDEKALEELTKATGTSVGDWGYPVQPSIEVRQTAQPNSPVLEKLGMHFVRVIDEPNPPQPAANQPPMLRVVTPSGKTGFLSAEVLSPLGNDQLCYVKEAGGWKIAGFIGGEP